MQELIRKLIEDFSKDRLKEFLDEKEDFEFREEFYRPEGIFSEIELVAERKLEDQNRFCVFAIETQGELSERSSKKRQFELAKKLLSDYDAGLFVFYDQFGSFRFSLVYKTYRGRKAEFSHYKRYTYFVERGKRYRTFEKALTELKFDTLQNIKQAFSTKPLIKEFYKEIQNWYAWALKDPKVRFPSGSKETSSSKETDLIRLITRLVFVWFLKEKGLVPAQIFEPEKLQHIVKDFMKSSNYYNVILQNLFFATLNTEIGKRAFAKAGNFLENRQDFGVKTLYRYQDLLKIPEQDFIKLFEETPFINGGLFECLDEDSNYVDGFTRNEKYRAIVPDYLFFSEERKENLSDFYGEERTEKVRGLINILKDYNWTADESTPIDVEVSLDPELLGHIFENLLASYNPETQQSARKSTGSYYTPQEIVDFMVEISLLEYLRQKTGIEQERLELLISAEGMPELSEEEKRAVLRAIDSLKCLDPAVGSGAFPMGMLHKLVSILEKVDPDNSLWKELQYEKTIRSIEEIFKQENKDMREELLRELNENFDTSMTYPDYARKLYIIQNSLYGVDIQNIAIQITKLRFFLSLLIDQKIDRQKPNLGIKPLPHLETNFVCANTLVKLTNSGQQRLIPHKVVELKKELLSLYKRHFGVRTRAEKKRLQERAKRIREEIKEELKKSGWSAEEVERIAKFDIFDQLAEADWFDPAWLFGVEEGFDIVIGNPPYIRQERLKDIKGQLKKDYKEAYDSTADIYVYFFARGYELLKPQGVLAYITSNKWLRAKYGKNLRRFFKENARIEYLVDFAGHRVFESATVDTSIVILSKIKEKNPAIKVAVADRELKEGSLREFIRSKVFYLSQDKLSDDVYVLEEEEVLRLKEKIEKVGKPLKDWDVRIYRGVLTGFNEAFIIDSQRREEILANCRDEEERRRTEEIIKPVLRGRDIGRYYYTFGGTYMIVSYRGINIENYPSLRSYLLTYKEKLKKRAGNQAWFELQAPPSREKLNTLLKEKIGYSDIGFRFCLVPSGIIGDNTTYFIIPTHFNHLMYILGLLNSKVLAYFHNLLASKLGGRATRGFTIYIEQLPIPPITDQNKPIVQKIENLVSQILQIKGQDPSADTTELERQIDQLVYQLYQLTPEEIRIIEERT